MTRCSQCGAELPDQARFCLNCGTAVAKEEPEPESEPSGFAQRPLPPAPPKPLEFLQPALAGGMFLGMLSALPLINLGNCLCCMWVLAGGGIGAILLSRQRPSGLTFGDGAFVGVLSGVFGSVVATAVHIPVQIISSRLFESQPQEMEQLFQQLGIEGPVRDGMLQMMSGEVTIATVLIIFLSYLLMSSLFAMIGGILTVAIMNKRAQAAPRTPGM